MTTESAEKLLDEWEVNSSLFQDSIQGAVPASVVYPPAAAIQQPIAQTQLVHIPQPQHTPIGRKSESYYLKLAAIVVGLPCITILSWLVLSSSSRQAATLGDQSTALGMMALSKPGSITIQQTCNSSFWGSPCDFPKVEAPQQAPAASVQSPNTAIAVNQPQQQLDQNLLAQFRQKSFEELDAIKARITQEQAAADPIAYQTLIAAWQEKRP